MVINGSDLIVFLDDVPVAHGTSYSINMQMNVRNTSNKDTGKFDTSAPGRIKITASSDSLVVYDNLQAMIGAFLAREVVHLAFGERTGAVLTDGEYVGGQLDETTFFQEGNFIITGLDQNAGDQDNASYTASFENADSSYSVSTDTALRLRLVKSDVTENAGADGFAAAIVKGGTPPYTYSWATDPEGTDQYISALEAGSYSVEVTDSATPTPGTVTGTVIINEPPAA